MKIEPKIIREQFPALSRPVIFFDNPGGTQIARQSLDRISRYLVETNANHGGAFTTSCASDLIVEQARQAMADFINAPRADEIILGPNMTTLTFRMSQVLGRTFTPGSAVVVTRLDHDANVTPWVRMAEDHQLQVRFIDFDPETGTLNLDELRATLSEGACLLAVGYASNALGTVNPLCDIIDMAHEAGALVYVDAVQYAPHGPIDVQRLGCDFLACSAYKFFGPHVGILWGRHSLLDSLRAYRVLPAPADPPGKFETGTNNFEGIAGLLGALEYLEWVGTTFGGEFLDLYTEEYDGRRLTYKQAMSAIRAYEFEISRQMIAALQSIPGLRIFGPSNPDHLEQRVPTFAFTIDGSSPEEVAVGLAEQDIFVWNGNFYALNVTERLGLESQGGLVRVGAVHYNTVDEIAALGEKLKGFLNA